MSRLLTRSRRALGCVLAVLAVAGLALGLVAPANAGRNIDVKVQTDGSLLVTETSQLRPSAIWCWHSVYAPDPKLPQQTAKVIAASINGVAVPWHTRFHPDGGTDIDVPVQGPGLKRTCKLSYRVFGAITRDAMTAHLSWLAVTPHDRYYVTIDHLTLEWPGRIDPTAATVTGTFRHTVTPATVTATGASLPDGIHVLDDAYRIDATFPASLLSDMPVPEKVPGLHRGLFWLALLVGYYGLALLFARRRGIGPVIAEYEPPDGRSPGMLRYLWRRGWDDQCLVAGILGLAAKGRLVVTRTPLGRGYMLARRDAHAPAQLAPDERLLCNALFAAGDRAPFTLNSQRLMDAGQVYREDIVDRCANTIFSDNALWLVPAWVLALAAVMTTMMPTTKAGSSSGLALVVAASLGQAAYYWLRRRDKLSQFAAAAGALLVLIPAASCVAYIGGPQRAWLVAAVVAIQLAATWWLLKLVGSGGNLRKKIEGFRWYLATAELPELRSRARHAKTADLYGSLLPWAMALDLAVPLNAHFSAEAERGGTSATPQPSWFDAGAAGAAFDGRHFVSVFGGSESAYP